MSVILKPSLMGKNAWRPQFGIAGEILYLPLWALPGGVITSADSSHYSCAVTGATHVAQGRAMDGNDWINLINFAPSFPLGSFTVIVWAYMAAWNDGASRELIDIADAGGENRFLIRKAAANTMLYYMASGGVGQFALPGSTPTAGWHHFAVSFSTNDCKTFIDLVNDGTDTTCVALAVAPTIGALGSYAAGGAGSYFNGIEGECSIYNRVLSTTELTQHRQLTKWRYI